MNGVSAFGFILKYARWTENLSIEDMAVRTTLTGAALRYIESGQRAPSFASAAQIADALGLPLDYFRAGLFELSKVSARMFEARDRAIAEWKKKKWTAEDSLFAVEPVQAVEEQQPAKADHPSHGLIASAKAFNDAFEDLYKPASMPATAASSETTTPAAKTKKARKRTKGTKKAGEPGNRGPRIAPAARSRAKPAPGIPLAQRAKKTAAKAK